MKSWINLETKHFTTVKTDFMELEKMIYDDLTMINIVNNMGKLKFYKLYWIINLNFGKSSYSV